VARPSAECQVSCVRCRVSGRLAPAA